MILFCKIYFFNYYFCRVWKAMRWSGARSVTQRSTWRARFRCSPHRSLRAPPHTLQVLTTRLTHSTTSTRCATTAVQQTSWSRPGFKTCQHSRNTCRRSMVRTTTSPQLSSPSCHQTMAPRPTPFRRRCLTLSIQTSWTTTQMVSAFQTIAILPVAWCR